jgi:hypothetical protein
MDPGSHGQIAGGDAASLVELVAPSPQIRKAQLLKVIALETVLQRYQKYTRAALASLLRHRVDRSHHRAMVLNPHSAQPHQHCPDGRAGRAL